MNRRGQKIMQLLLRVKNLEKQINFLLEDGRNGRETLLIATSGFEPEHPT